MSGITSFGMFPLTSDLYFLTFDLCPLISIYSPLPSPSPFMRPPVQLEKLQALMSAMGRAVKSPGRVYLTGGATALLHGWRPMTVDVDLKADP